MLFVRKGRGRVWAIGWSAAQCWVPCSPLHSLFLPRPVRGQRERSPKLVFGKAIGEDVSVGTSCKLFHIWAIINHGLRLGKRPQGGRPCGAGAVTCLLTDERSDPPTSPQWPLNP